jgi:hypothetical protein
MSQMSFPASIPGPGGGGYPAVPGSIYQNQVAQAQTDYGTVMQGYAQTLNNQQQGYGAIGSQVANTLGYGGTPWGVAAPAAQSIADQYAAQMGQSQQGLINSGLGNSTVLQSVQRGIGLDAAKAYSGLGAQLAQTYAGYQSQIGLAGMGAQNATMAQQSGYQGAYHNAGYTVGPQAQRMAGGGVVGGSGGGGVPRAPSSPSGSGQLGGQLNQETGTTQLVGAPPPPPTVPGLPGINTEWNPFSEQGQNAQGVESPPNVPGYGNSDPAYNNLQASNMSGNYGSYSNYGYA